MDTSFRASSVSPFALVILATPYIFLSFFFALIVTGGTDDHPLRE